VTDEAIGDLVARLARPHPSGGRVIERAAILAEGADFTSVIGWIIEHAGVPEEAPEPLSLGLHGNRLNHRAGAGAGSETRRFVLPAGQLTD
jgi:hypothetical protein